MTDAVSTQTLAQAIGFTDADLVANRDGNLSEAQLFALQKRRSRVIYIGLGAFGVLTILATLFLFMGSKPDNSGILSIIGIGLSICNAFMIGIFFRAWLRLNGDINGGRVLAISGKLERVLKPLNRRVMNYMIRIETVEMYVNKEVFIAFEHEATYTLYRTPYNRTLVSAERG
ncbi:MAG: hypothetical protein KJ043_19420 [Anaerolineae bacterium]|nr:hypothetical protein [Anaerolineae bacterium]